MIVTGHWQFFLGLPLGAVLGIGILLLLERWGKP